jgi:hypothetical protein
LAVFPELNPVFSPPPQKIKKSSLNFPFQGIPFGFSEEANFFSAGINFTDAKGAYNFAVTKPIKTNAMKTIAKTLVLISILMISITVTAGNNQPMAGKVIYKVQIHLPKDMPFRTQNVYVVMVNERNEPIAPPQLLTYGKSTYEFTENNSLIGTRKAELIWSDGTISRLFNSKPDAQSGKFVIGNTYIFNIWVAFEKPVLSAY